MRSSEVTSAAHERGRDAYRRKDYTTALACFDRAIARGGPSAQLLDNRAACHEKLSNLPLALKDAKATIQAWRDDPTGYLRAGKILVQMNKPSTAFEVFSHGLRTVKHVGQGYETLRKAHEDLQAKVAPRKSIDPMTVLPRELAEQVLEYLSFRQRMNACMVSMAWTQFVRSAPRLWTHLDLTRAKKRVKNAFISRAINSARKKIHSATLTNRLENFDKTVTALLHHCDLRELTLLDAGVQSESLVEALTHSEHLEALRLCAGTQLTFLAFCDLFKGQMNGLKVLRCQDLVGIAPTAYSINLHSLQELDLRFNVSQLGLLQGSDFLHQLITLSTLKVCIHNTDTCRSRMIRPLHLDLSTLTKLEAVHLELALPLTDLVLPSTIRSLILRLDWHTPNTFWYEPFALPELEAFTLRADLHGMDDIQKFLCSATERTQFESRTNNTKRHSSWSKLRRFVIDYRWCSPFTTPGLIELLAHDRLSDLEELGLIDNGAYMDDVILAQPKCFRTLETLNLSGTNITGIGVRALLQHKQLKRLIVNNCMTLGRDAIDLAVKQGVSVEHRIGD